MTNTDISYSKLERLGKVLEYQLSSFLEDKELLLTKYELMPNLENPDGVIFKLYWRGHKDKHMGFTTQPIMLNIPKDPEQLKEEIDVIKAWILLQIGGK